MSNLLKSVYFNVNRTEKVIIDSNKKKIGTPVQPPVNALKAIPGFEFVPGIHVLNVDQLIEKEKEKEKEGQKFNKEANAIIEEAKKKANTMIERANDEVESIKRDAHRQGFEQGRLEGQEQGREECQKLEQELLERQQGLENDYKRKMSELEPMFANLAANLIQKVTGILVEDHKEIILYLLGQALRNTPKSEKYIIQASKEDIYYLESKKDELKSNLRGNAVLELVENEALEKNQCIIEMDDQMVDCSLDVQLRRLSEELKILSMT